jgi:hypothetical protein
MFDVDKKNMKRKGGRNPVRGSSPKSKTAKAETVLEEMTLTETLFDSLTSLRERFHQMED